MSKRKVMFIASTGGHLEELLQTYFNGSFKGKFNVYGFEVWTSISSEKDEYDNEIIGAKINIKGQVSDESLEGFLDDADHLKFKIKKLKVSDKKETSSVHNSSFSSYYNYDFEVICTKDGEEVFHETITDVTIGSYFFSGGW